ncbi:MAG: hypothetical protein WC843_04470 [Candidatus Gracilibacteria bacterium]|jgi:hypothetical protein
MKFKVNTRAAGYINAIGVLFLSSIFLMMTACQKSSGTDKALSSHPLDRRIGSVSSIGNVPHVKGTNILTLDDGSTILLNSTKINLDDPKYKNKRVEVSGFSDYASDGKQLMEVANIDVLAGAITTQPLEALNWKDYNNPGLGFGIKYRNDFEVKDAPNGENGVLLWNPVEVVSGTQATTQQTQVKTQQGQSGYSVKITLLPVKTQKDFIASLSLKNENPSPTELLTAGLVQSKIGTNSLVAYKKTDATGKIVDFYVNDAPKFFHITFNTQAIPDDQFTDAQKLFYEMIASFQVGAPPIQPVPPAQPGVTQQ